MDKRMDVSTFMTSLMKRGDFSHYLRKKEKFSCMMLGLHMGIQVAFFLAGDEPGGLMSPSRCSSFSLFSLSLSNWI